LTQGQLIQRHETAVSLAAPLHAPPQSFRRKIGFYRGAERLSSDR